MSLRASWNANSVHASEYEAQMDSTSTKRPSRHCRVVPEFGREDIREVFLRSYRLVYLIGDDAIEVLTVFEGHRLLETDQGTEPLQRNR